MAGKEHDTINENDKKLETSEESAHLETEATESEASEAEVANDPTDEAANIDDDEQSSADEAQADLRLELQRLSQERDQLAAQYTRLRADFENFRRRKEEEIANLKLNAAADMATRLLPVLDNLERAAASGGSEAEDAPENPFLQGVNLVLRQFKQELEQAGVEVIPSVGHPFNPEVHEAVMQVDPGDTYEPGTVVEELQRGYRMGDRVLRYSMVNVAASD